MAKKKGSKLVRSSPPEDAKSIPDAQLYIPPADLDSSFPIVCVGVQAVLDTLIPRETEVRSQAGLVSATKVSAVGSGGSFP
jgi:hypothetical protein